MAEITPLVVVNRACAMFGNEPLQSLDEETLGGQRVQLVYDSLFDFCSALIPWTFMRQSVELARLAVPAGYTEATWTGYPNGYRECFQVLQGFHISPNRILRSQDLLR
jgi:hypothetical protein